MLVQIKYLKIYMYNMYSDFIKFMSTKKKEKLTLTMEGSFLQF